MKIFLMMVKAYNKMLWNAQVLKSLKTASFIIFLALISGCKEDPTESPVSLEDQITAYLEDFAFVGSASVTMNGNVIVERGFGFANHEQEESNTPETQFRIGSITKPFTAMAILQLEEAGQLSVNDPFSKYVPDFPNADKISIKNLLEHSSGIPNYTDLPEFLESLEEERTVDEVIDVFRDKPLVFDPGTQFSYSNSGYVMLGKIIEVVAGMPYALYMEQRIFSPAGLTQTSYGSNELGVNRRAVGYVNNYEIAPFIDMSWPHAAGGLSSSVRDLQQWSLAIDDHALISESSTTRMFTNYNAGYGFGWILGDIDGSGFQAHDGGIPGFNSILLRMVDAQVTIVILSNNSRFDTGQMAEEIWRLMAASGS